jgi:hypothetical protein
MIWRDGEAEHHPDDRLSKTINKNRESNEGPVGNSKGGRDQERSSEKGCR